MPLCHNTGKDNGTSGRGVHPGLRKISGDLAATMVRVAAYLGGVAVLVVVAAKFFETPTAAPAARSAWTDVERPFRAFALTMPEFAEPEPAYSIRRHETGGGRKDIMTWGMRPRGPSSNDTDDGGTRLLIEIYRPGKELERFGDPASEVAARTGGARRTIRAAAERAVPEQIRPHRDVRVHRRGRGATAQCLGFVRNTDEPLLQIAGWYCRGGIEVIDRNPLSCAFERLSLVMAASEPKVTKLFAEAELARKLCPPRAKPGSGCRTPYERLDQCGKGAAVAGPHHRTLKTHRIGNVRS